ncbi:MAG: hypothetical protein ACKPKO_10520, partial [Candidatus Fonsibacter sp.]
ATKPHHFNRSTTATLETIPTACLTPYLHVWTETLEGMITGSQEGADLGATFTKPFLTCVKKGEDRFAEIQHRLWSIEEGGVDELAMSMQQM